MTPHTAFALSGLCSSLRCHLSSILPTRCAWGGPVFDLQLFSKAFDTPEKLIRPSAAAADRLCQEFKDMLFSCHFRQPSDGTRFCHAETFDGNAYWLKPRRAPMSPELRADMAEDSNMDIVERLAQCWGEHLVEVWGSLTSRFDRFQSGLQHFLD